MWLRVYRWSIDIGDQNFNTVEILSMTSSLWYPIDKKMTEMAVDNIDVNGFRMMNATSPKTWVSGMDRE